MQYTLGFIGCGNMGGALAKAAAKTVRGEQIALCDRHAEKISPLVKDLGMRCATAEEIASKAHFVLLGVKPQAMAAALSPIADALKGRKDCVLVTMAAGLSIAGLCDMVGGNMPVIRIMPNTPVAVGEGMTLYASEGVDEDTLSAFLRYFSKAGKFHRVAESAIDGGSALSGCGPAFVYAFAEALIDGGVACGITEEEATLLAAQTLKGAAEMLLRQGDPASLKRAVCSPGGTTVAGLAALENSAFHDEVKNTVLASYRRTLELKK